MLVAIAFATATQAQVPVITAHPQNATVCAGSPATFSVAASNNPTSYQWEISLDKGSTWNIVTGNTTNYNAVGISTGTFIVSVNQDVILEYDDEGFQIRSRANNSSGSSEPSIPALLKILRATDSLYISKPNTTPTCVANNFQLAGSVANGVWSSSNNNVASVNCIGGVSIKTQGTANINYVYTGINGCKDTAQYSINSNGPSAATINGANSVCVGATPTYTANVNNGIWSSDGRMTINATTGATTTTSAGKTNVNYTIFNNVNGCNTKTTYPISIVQTPAMPSISFAPGNTTNPIVPGGGNRFCNGRSFVLRGSPSGGSWSATGGLSINTLTVQDARFNTTTTGAYDLAYTVSNGTCSNKRSFTGTVISCSKGIVKSTQTNEPLNVYIYPNPVSCNSAINIKLNKNVNNVTMKITDMLGKTVHQQVLNSTFIEGVGDVVNCRLSKGLYFVKITCNEGTFAQKIMVE